MHRYIARGGTKLSVGYTVVNASIIVAVCLTALLIGNDIASDKGLGITSYLAFGAIAYLIGIRWLLHNNKVILAHWFIIGLFGTVGLSTLFFWGIDTASGILTLGFVITLPGVLLGARRMPLIFGIVATLLVLIQTVHQFGIFTPDTRHYSEVIVFEDVIAYILILATFSLVIWLSLRRAEFSLHRARHAEKKLRQQKDSLKVRLDQESARLRANQQKEIQQLHSFAVLGQNTAATLHELSNHLAVLGMDIEGLHETNRHSKAIDDAQESFRQVTAMVKTIRRQLNTYSAASSIIIQGVLKDIVHDIKATAGKNTPVTLSFDESLGKPFSINTDPVAISHIVTILIKNAIEACEGFPNARVALFAVRTKSTIRVTVSDSGIGVPEGAIAALFTPTTSTKPTGLGAGLFIARNLAKTQLGGTLRLAANGTPNERKHQLSGATFSLEIPIKQIKVDS